MIKKTVLLTFLALAACNTVKGVGRDIQSVGHAITGSAEENRQRAGNSG